MKGRKAVGALAVAFFALLSAPPAVRAEGASPIASTTQDTPAQALMARLAEGGKSASELAALYLALARAHARAGDDAAARSAFVAALAIDPSFRLDKQEPVEVRSPYMEARGFWSMHAERLSASAALGAEGSALEVELHDPAELVARVVVRTRAPGAAGFSETVLARSARARVELPAPLQRGPLSYALLLLDAYGNRLWQAGSESAPLELGSDARATPPQVATPTAQQAERSTPSSQRDAGSARGLRIAAAASFVLAAVAAGAGGFEHHARQADARRWNDADCTGPGATRGEVCGGVRDQLRRAERAAIGLYAGSAAALTTGAVLLVMARLRRADAERPRALACAPSARGIGLDCSGRF